MATIYAQTNTTIRATKAEIRKELRLAGRAVKGISRSGTISGAGSNDSLLTQKAVRDYVTVMIASGRVTLRNAKPSPLTTYISELVIDTVGVDSAWVWNFSIYRLLQIGVSSSTDLSYITDAVTGIVSNSNGSGFVIPEATDLIAGLLSATKKLQYDSKNAGVQFKDEGSNLGTQGTVINIDVTGAGATASRIGNTVTINVPGGVGIPKLTVDETTITPSLTGNINKNLFLRDTLNQKYLIDSSGKAHHFDNQYEFNRGALRSWFRDYQEVFFEDSTSNILMLGDSHFDRTEGPHKSMQQMFAANSGFVGPGYVYLDPNPLRPPYGVTVDTNGVWTQRSYETTPKGKGVNLRSVVSSSAGANIVIETVTLEKTVAKFDSYKILYWKTSGGGTFSYKVDGGAATNVSTNASDGVGVVSISSGLTYGQHTITLANVSGTVELLGVILYRKNTAGVMVHKAARGGLAIKDVYDADSLTFVQNLRAFNPHLIIVEGGTNDNAAGTSIANFRLYYQSMINRIKAAANRGASDEIPIILCSTPDISTYYGYADPRLYDEVIRELAWKNNCMFFDLRGVVREMEKTEGQPNQIYSGDNVHLSERGARIVASELFRRLTSGNAAFVVGGASTEENFISGQKLVFQNATISKSATGVVTVDVGAISSGSGALTEITATASSLDTINFQQRQSGFFQISLGTDDADTIYWVNPATLVVPKYDIHFLVTDTTDVTFPTNFFYENGDSLLTRSIANSCWAQIYYDGERFWISDSLGVRTSGGSVTPPGELITSGLVFHLEAGTDVLDNAGGSISNGESVGTWGDISGNNLDVTQVTATQYPTYVAGAINGYPAVRFDGVNDNLDIPNSSILKPDSLTVVIVYADKGTDGVVLNYANGGSLASGYRLDFAAGMRSGVYTSSSTFATKSNTYGSAFVIHSLRYNGSNIYCRVNDDVVVASKTGAVTYTTANSLYLGQYADSTSPAQTDIAEVLVYNRPLSSAELEQVYDYLRAKFGL